MKKLIKIFVDFNNCDTEGRVRFTKGSFLDIKNNNLELKTGIEVWLDDEEGLAIEGIVEFSSTENVWVARFDWKKLNEISPNKP